MAAPLLLLFVGLVFLFTLGRLLLATRALLRPGVLWFFRDPDNFHPIRDILERTLLVHIRRLITSSMVYLLVASATVAIPVRVLMLFGVKCSLRLSIETPAPLFFINLMLPAAVSYLQPTVLGHILLRLWLVHVSRAVGLEAYLYRMPAVPAAEVPLFWPRVVTFLALALGSLSAVVVSLTLPPILLGRELLNALPAKLQPNDLLAAMLGFYTLLACACVARWAARRFHTHSLSVGAAWGVFLQLSKVAIAGVLWLGVAPLVLGMLIELALFAPFVHAPLATFRLDYFSDWVIGAFHLHFWAKGVLAGGPPASLRPALERVRRDGWSGFALEPALRDLLWPILRLLLLTWSLPVVVWEGLLPLVAPWAARAGLVALHYSYLVMAAAAAAVYAAGQLTRLLWRIHDDLRDEVFLVGRSLQNVQLPPAPLGPAAPTAAPPAVAAGAADGELGS
jgi:E3 ubiquitin-protein ligase MARCH6